MNVRILSRVVCRVLGIALMVTATTNCCSRAAAQTGAGFYTDPATGIVYQRVTRTIERPVSETKITSRQQTVYRPQTVTETKPHARTVYTPVVEYNWEPRVQGRWNPFRLPTVAYHHVARTHWERRHDIVHRTSTRTDWVAEKRTVEVPSRIVRIQREQQVDYEPVGRVAPQQATPPGAGNSLASRLRPLPAGASITPLNQPFRSTTQLASSRYSAPRIASSTVSPSYTPGRSSQQSGMQSNDLYPTIPVQGLPPVRTGIGIATLPAPPIFR